MRRVIVETPFAGRGSDEDERFEDQAANVEYARACMRDSLLRNESPLASHLLYPQVLDDTVFEERRLGIAAGLEWYKFAQACVVYLDNGFSPGMLEGMRRAGLHGVPVEKRYLQRKSDEAA